jgi:hypothetical protein
MSFLNRGKHMRRVIGAAAAAAAATLTAAVVMVPAFAATGPAGRAALARTAAHGTTGHRAGGTLADVITSDFGAGGQYVTVVRCAGTGSAPPPVRLARRDDPLTVRGAHPAAAIVKLVGKARAYKTVYTCTVIVKEKVPPAKKKPPLGGTRSCELGAGRGWLGWWRSCHHEVILNTGFGGEAGPVASHHPAG